MRGEGDVDCIEEMYRCFSYLLEIIGGILTHTDEILGGCEELAGCGGFLSSACCTSISADVVEHWRRIGLSNPSSTRVQPTNRIHWLSIQAVPKYVYGDVYKY